jgi:hypothetical protein
MTFFLDLWQDLREKRLWPVAVGLLGAAIAIPAVWLKPASAPEQPAVAAKPAAPELLPMVKVDDQPSHGSKLETFAGSERNPFRSLADLKKDPGAGSGTTTVHGGSLGGGPAAAAANARDQASSSGAPSGASSAGGGSAGGGASGGGSTPPGIDPNGPRVQWFKYTADLKFGAPNHLKTKKGVTSLTLLPSEKNPAIVFMGVTDDAKSAVFFIADPAFKAEGEGKCNSRKHCTFVKLGVSDTRNEESFISQDGSVQYDIKLLRLNRENISSSQAKGDAKDSKSKPYGKAAKNEPASAFLPGLLFLPGVARKAQ